MVVITSMPSEAIISGFKGTIDFYEYMGLAVARTWPRSPGRKRAPAVEAQWENWAYAAREWRNLSPTVQDAYRALGHSSGLSCRDLQVRGYLAGIYKYAIP
jgi:hypothetical protein